MSDYFIFPFRVETKKVNEPIEVYKLISPKFNLFVNYLYLFHYSDSYLFSPFRGFLKFSSIITTPRPKKVLKLEALERQISSLFPESSVRFLLLRNFDYPLISCLSEFFEFKSFREVSFIPLYEKLNCRRLVCKSIFDKIDYLSLKFNGFC